MKRLLLISICIFPLFALAQKDTTKINLPVKDSLIFYEKTFVIENATKDKIFNSVIQWCAATFINSNDVIKLSDRQNGEIIGVGTTIIATPGFIGLNYNIRFLFRIDIQDNKYRLQLTNFTKIIDASIHDFNNYYYPVEQTYFSLINKKDIYSPKEDRKFFIALNREATKTLNSISSSVSNSISNNF